MEKGWPSTVEMIRRKEMNNFSRRETGNLFQRQDDGPPNFSAPLLETFSVKNEKEERFLSRRPHGAQLVTANNKAPP